jgi:peptide deformylase
MARLSVVKYPDPTLSRRAKEVEKITPELARLMDDMAETMYAESGVGLAAPQVGISKRIIVIDVSVELGSGMKKKQLVQLANPVITSSQGEMEWEEGCLSVPEFRTKVRRKAKIAVKGINKQGKEVEFLAEGLLSVAFQHEIDHLDGKLLIDRAGKKEREKYLKMRKNLVIC